MSKLAHGHQPTMDAIDAKRAVADGNDDLLANPIDNVLSACRQAYEATPNTYTEHALAEAIELHETFKPARSAA